MAKFVLETPGAMGMETQWAALAIKFRLSPSRSAPKASMASDGNNPCRNGSPPGAITTKGLRQAGRESIQATGIAYGNPVAAMTAAGYIGRLPALFGQAAFRCVFAHARRSRWRSVTRFVVLWVG